MFLSLPLSLLLLAQLMVCLRLSSLNFISTDLYCTLWITSGDPSSRSWILPSDWCKLLLNLTVTGFSAHLSSHLAFTSPISVGYILFLLFVKLLFVLVFPLASMSIFPTITLKSLLSSVLPNSSGRDTSSYQHFLFVFFFPFPVCSQSSVSAFSVTLKIGGYHILLVSYDPLDRSEKIGCSCWNWLGCSSWGEPEHRSFHPHLLSLAQREH